jgi:hypothetical protein
MKNIYDLFKEIHIPHGNKVEGSWQAFIDWYGMAGKNLSEPGRLKWILESPKIDDCLKKELIEAIADKSQVVEDEENVLFKFGCPSERHEENVEKTTQDLIDRFSRMRKLYFLAAAVFMLTYLFVNVYCEASASTGLGKFAAMVFFGIAVICFAQGWDMTSHINSAKSEAARIEEGLIGNKVQKRIGEIEKEERQLYVLSKIIVRSGITTADKTDVQ